MDRSTDKYIHYYSPSKFTILFTQNLCPCIGLVDLRRGCCLNFWGALGPPPPLAPAPGSLPRPCK